jgi:choline dehydrogenase
VTVNAVRKGKMDWDYVIVGAGSAGCALANALTRSGRNESILVLEAGGSDRSPYVKVPAGVLYPSPHRDWGYTATPDSTRNGTVEHWMAGKVLGGSSSVNGTIYIRGAAADFDRWDNLCGHAGGWSARDVMPIFREMEHSDQDGPLRGNDGPLYVRTVKHPHRITEAFIQAACAVGYPLNDDYNARSQEGVGYVQLTQRRGLRCSSADAFLKPLLRHGKNVKLILNALVERVEVARGRAEAVIFSLHGKQRREVARNIILCAGAINSPKLLMLSGIGDARELARHSIPLVVDLPGVGRNLRQHPLAQLSYRIRIPTNNPTEGWLQKLGIVGKFMMQGEGPISNLFEGVGFVRSCGSQPTPDLQLLFLTVGFSRTPDGGYRPGSSPGVMIYVTHSYPLTAGQVRLTSSTPSAPPSIDHFLLAERSDIDAMVLGVQAVRRIMSTDPIASLVVEETSPGAAATSPAAIEAFLQAHTSICYHSIGTCRMGADEGSVVSPELRVRGTENLWIADASIMPDTISANTNAPCMMIGFKLGKQLIAGH